MAILSLAHLLSPSTWLHEFCSFTAIGASKFVDAIKDLRWKSHVVKSSNTFWCSFEDDPRKNKVIDFVNELMVL
ncbi:hypothetical protein ACTXT7_005132 [Hymenolepis weldensis]